MTATKPLWTGAEIAAATGGRLIGDDFAVSGLTYDSREIGPDQLFLALKGARDGHDFAGQAFAAGAAGALVDHAVEGGPQVVVADTLKGLEALGATARTRAHLRGAVTGSVGKTSVTQAIKAGLDLAGPAHASIKSYNNHIGVPLTLARTPRGTERAVFEIGMNAPGEIAPLARMVQPHAACVTTIGPVHVEGFSDGEAGIAAEKAAIFEGLSPGGVAVINLDTPWTEVQVAAAEARKAEVWGFGRHPSARARLTGHRVTEDGAVVTAEIDSRAIEFPLIQTGAHWAMNSLCVVLMLEALEVPIETAQAALAAFSPLAGRGETRQVTIPGGAFTLIDESYNANPLSMTAGFLTLGRRAVPEGGRRVVVLSDMLELGDRSTELHEGLAGPIAQADIDLVHTAGPRMKALHDALPPERRGLWTETAADLAAQAADLIRAGDVVMVKGSNGSKASLVAKALAALDADTPPSSSGSPREPR